MDREEAIRFKTTDPSFLRLGSPLAATPTDDWLEEDMIHQPVTTGCVDRPRDSGYHLARMAFEIVLAAESVSDLRRLSAHDRAKVRDAMEVHLRHEPTKLSKS